MATDLFGNPLAKLPEYRLSLWQKRQAAMLYRWMSIDYLKGLKDLIDALIKGADVTLELAKRQGRDALIANPRWGVRDTAANWSTYVYPALEDFRRSTIWHISAVAKEEYGKTGATQCDRMLSEFSSRWMTQEEEERFNAQAAVVFSYASKIDDAAGAGGARYLNDFTMTMVWFEEEAALIPRLPKFRVRTDVEGKTAKRPARTGVYVPQDDPHGVLQFGWTGNDDGKLGRVQTFNDIGLHALRSIGRDALWIDETRMVAYVAQELRQGRLQPVRGIDGKTIGAENVDDRASAKTVLLKQVFTERPCKWYFVEQIDGEFDDEAESSAEPMAVQSRLRCEAGQPCPQAGYWLTPAKAGSRRYCKQGEAMPEVGSTYGHTIWQWDEDQSASGS